MNLLQSNDQDIYKCSICTKTFEDPIVTPDCMIYCEKCIIEWNSKNNTNPKGGVKSTGWVKNQILNELLMRGQIFTNLNLLKLIDNDFTKIDPLMAKEILDAIDIENHHRINEESNRTIILKKIFMNHGLIKQLLQMLGPNINTWKGVDGWGIVHYVVRFGNIELIEYVINNYPLEINLATNSNHTLLYFIFSKSNCLNSEDQVKIINILINKKIDLNVPQSKNKDSLINFVCGQGNNLNSGDQLKVIIMMVENKVNLGVLSTDTWYSIHLVCSGSNNLHSSDQLKAIKILIDNNVDLNVENKNNWRPIHFVCSGSNNLNSSDQLKAIKMLVEAKVELNVCTDGKSYPIHFVCNKNNKLDPVDRFEAIKLLINNNVDLNVTNSNSINPIHYVCDMNNLASNDKLTIIQSMIERKVGPKVGPKVDLEVVDSDGRPPIHYICSKTNFSSSDQLEAIKLFVNQKVNLEIPCGKNKEYPIHLICMSSENNMNEDDQLKAITLLIDQKINLTAVTLNGWTPLHLICHENNRMSLRYRVRTIELLLSKMTPDELGRNLEMMTSDGMCPIDVIKTKLNKSNEEKSRLIDVLYSTLY